LPLLHTKLEEALCSCRPVHHLAGVERFHSAESAGALLLAAEAEWLPEEGQEEAGAAVSAGCALPARALGGREV
jgi:hypothetical protein